MVIFVIVVYVLCWVFELLIYFLGFIGIIILQLFYYVVVFVLIVFNFSINLIVYSLQSSKFRKYFGELICCMKRNVVIFFKNSGFIVDGKLDIMEMEWDE